MNFNDDDIREFALEATELLESSESSLLALDEKGDFQSNYDAVFRAFHSIKGGAGMLGLDALQSHMHQMENFFTQCKSRKAIAKHEVDFFLKGIDAARSLLAGNEVTFDYNVFSAGATQSAPAVAAAPTAAPTTITTKAATATPTTATQKTTPAPSQKPNQNPSPTPDSKNVIPFKSNSKPSPNKSSAIGKALVVDDEPDLVEIISGILSEAGFEVLGKTDPLEALAAVSTFCPDIVVSDISMPKMNGMQLLQKVHEINPELPFMIVSGYVTKEVLLSSIENGVYCVLEKPFDEKRVITAAINATKRYKLSKLLNQSVNLIIYQFSDLDEYLKTTGKEQVRQMLNQEVKSLMEQRRQLKELKKKAA